ncbi:iron chelate uptake ABC transporter family permease subunit [Pseudoalteromonas sp. 2CM39R]|uniref:FecCD family ABC transporter permease n=1 Tax=Pseudoalteromonas sp. 2CM39R TaxID=2929856 RepID=UPI0020BE5004|nr:iron chelate uptake ABC transporter family permease subunit [Pseudoalteromonas sp. 2CM39R]MCK8123880.1 iron chelate uptake ABC transporter family permease subunit [Pseudoalteromonas sp. 2CM39R]
MKRMSIRTQLCSFQLSTRSVIVIFSLSIFTVTLLVYALVAGSKMLSLTDLSAFFLLQPVADIKQMILVDVRLPRVLTALFAGASLGVSGGVFQTILRNPLGSPDVLGLSAGSASGVIFSLMFIGQSAFLIASSAIIGGVITAFLLYILALRRFANDSFRLILIGIGIGAVATAFNGLMLVKGELDKAMLATLWMAGSLDGRTWHHVVYAALPVMFILPILAYLQRAISTIEMGDMIASSLGINVINTRLISLLCAVLLVALATAAVGPIAFIALIAPQLALKLMSKSGFSLAGSALMGSALLLSADTLLQALSLDSHFPVGRMTAALGALYLLWLLAGPMRKHYASK